MLTVYIFCTQEKQHNFRHYEIGENVDLSKPKKVIMMVGMTGAGKSLMLNNMVNFFYGVDLDDDFRFKLILDEEEIAERKLAGDNSTSSAESMTRWVSSYTLHYQEGSRVPCTLVLIDTPGFGDTRRIQFDENISKSLKEFFNSKEYPVDEISSIGLVIQASQARLTAEQMYVFNSVQNIFGNDVTKNICLLFTFADAQPPPALETVKKEKIPFPEDGVFKFNNSALYAKKDDESNGYYWKFGTDGLEKFFRHIRQITPTSLTLTKEVLNERENLQLTLVALQNWISEGFLKLENIENVTRTITELKGTMQANKDFCITQSTEEQSTKIINHDITNCVSCQFTCHDPCYIKGDHKKECASMKNGICVTCPGKCPWSTHRNGNRY